MRNSRHCLKIIFYSLCLASLHAARADNLIIANTRWTADATDSAKTRLLFDISWDSSWRASWQEGSRTVTNWDAAWIFVKSRDDNKQWQYLKIMNHDQLAPAGCVIQVPSDGAGAFLYAAEEHHGKISFKNVSLLLQSTRSQVDSNDFRVFGVEMVLIPAGPFLLGNGPGASSSFFQHPTPGKPFPIESEAAFPLGNSKGALAFHTSKYNPPLAGTVPAGFPKGYNAFYCMKHPLRWKDVTDMLNLLTRQQAESLFNFENNLGSGFFKGEHPLLSATKPNDYCGNLRWPDGAAVADWQGLRPMTELEYEKALRGSYEQIKSSIKPDMPDDMFLPDDGEPVLETTPSRKSVNGYWVDFEWGPFRGTATSALPKNTMYYGVVANPFCEQCVTVGHLKGWEFQGSHGDGELTPDGHANQSDWPAADGLGSGYRGHYGPKSHSLKLFDRCLAACGHSSYGHGEKGWRSVRTAP